MKLQLTVGFFQKEVELPLRKLQTIFLKSLNQTSGLVRFTNILITFPNIIFHLSFHNLPQSYEKITLKKSAK